MGRAESWVTCIVGRARQLSPGKTWIAGCAILVWGMINPLARVMDWNHESCDACVAHSCCVFEVISLCFMYLELPKTPFIQAAFLFIFLWISGISPRPNAVNPSPRMLCFSVDLLDLHSYRLFSSSVYTSFSYGFGWILIHAPPFASYDCCEGCGRN